jgi:hypothetical protein
MQKLKRDVQGQIGLFPFVAIWTIGIVIIQTIAGVVSTWLFSLMDGSVMERLNPLILINSLDTLLIAFLQVQLVERLLKRSMRGWTLFTIASLVTSWALYILFQQPFIIESPFLLWVYGLLGAYTSTVVGVLTFALPIALFQTLWLRRHVRDTHDAWIWPITTIVIGAVSQGLQMYILSNPQYSRDIMPIVNLVMLLIYGVSTGLIMRSLITHPKEMQKAKVDDVDSNLVYSSREARLQDTSNETADTSAYQRPKQQHVP